MEENEDVVVYIPDFFPEWEEAFHILWNELDWERREGAPRREYWTNTFNAPYTYGKNEGIRTYYSRPNHPVIERGRELLRDWMGHYYEACFLNGYETGKDALGYHADDSKDINHDIGIAVITVGGPREIAYMANGDEASQKRIMLESGSLFFMKPGMQSTHKHKIPRAGHAVRMPRVSLTYRALKTPNA